MRRVAALLAFFIPLATIASAQDEPEFYDPVEMKLEGWTVKVDPRLLSGEHKETGDAALKALANHLQRITYVMPAEPLKKMRELPLWLELENDALKKIGGHNMQFHPGRGWLVENGLDPRLVKHVHIPSAEQLTDSRQWAKHPYVVLHELAHAYHNQVLEGGFSNPLVKAAYDNAVESDDYEEVLSHTGRKVRHYGLNNQMEYFAETTEAYFGVNDFYPFVRAELKEFDPKGFALMEEIWGSLRG